MGEDESRERFAHNLDRKAAQLDQISFTGLSEEGATSAVMTPPLASNSREPSPEGSPYGNGAANSAAHHLVARIEKLRQEAEEAARAANNDRQACEQMRESIEHGRAMLQEERENAEAKMAETRNAIAAAKAAVQKRQGVLTRARRDRDQVCMDMCAIGAKFAATRLEIDWLTRIFHNFEENQMQGFKKGDNVVILKKGNFQYCAAVVVGTLSVGNSEDKVQVQIVQSSHEKKIMSYAPYDLRRLVFNKGDQVRILKHGTFKGAICTVLDPVWGERVKVRMADGAIKSYLPAEVELISLGPAFQPPEDGHSNLHLPGGMHTVKRDMSFTSPSPKATHSVRFSQQQDTDILLPGRGRVEHDAVGSPGSPTGRSRSRTDDGFGAPRKKESGLGSRFSVAAGVPYSFSSKN